MITISDALNTETQRMALHEKINRRAAEVAEQRPQRAAPTRKPVQHDGLCAPDCPICAGMGWVRTGVQDILDPRFGKMELCPNVSIWRIGGQERWGLDREEAEQLDWELVKPLKGSGAPAAVKAVQEVLAAGYGWVYLWGNHGQAKTMILKIAIAEWLKQQRQAAYANMAAILSHMRDAYDSDNPSLVSQQRMDFWQSVPLLAIDEFDRFNPTQWANVTQFTLMDTRNVAAIRGNSITLIASNKSPEQLDSYYRSRVQDGRFAVIALNGPDQRPNMSVKDLW